jgi:AraC-like DNA-binding protein
MPRSITVDEICQLLLALLNSGYPTIDKVARLLHSSPRSLQRRLRKEGVAYAELVSRCRCKEAQRLLVRAFMSWTGTSPRNYRRQQRCSDND